MASQGTGHPHRHIARERRSTPIVKCNSRDQRPCRGSVHALTATATGRPNGHRSRRIPERLPKPIGSISLCRKMSAQTTAHLFTAGTSNSTSVALRRVHSNAIASALALRDSSMEKRSNWQANCSHCKFNAHSPMPRVLATNNRLRILWDVFARSVLALSDLPAGRPVMLFGLERTHRNYEPVPTPLAAIGIASVPALGMLARRHACDAVDDAASPLRRHRQLGVDDRCLAHVAGMCRRRSEKSAECMRTCAHCAHRFAS